MGIGAERPGLSCLSGVYLFPAYSDDSPLCELLVWSRHRSLKRVLFFLSFSLERQCLIYPFFLTSGRAGLCEQETVRTVGVVLVLQLPFVTFACITHVTGDTHGLALSILNVHRLVWVHFSEHAGICFFAWLLMNWIINGTSPLPEVQLQDRWASSFRACCR